MAAHSPQAKRKRPRSGKSKAPQAGPSAARRELLDRYHDAGFFEAKLEIEPRIDEANRSVDLRVIVQEGKRTLLFFEGNDVIADHELEAMTPFSEARSVDVVELDRTVALIRAAYQERGYHHATVRPHIVPTPDRGVRHLVFEIHEGPVARVERIRFLGNKAFTDDELSDIVGTQTFNSLLGRPGFALDAQLEADTQSLVSHYHEHGFLRATATLAAAVRCPASAGDATHRRSVQLSTAPPWPNATHGSSAR